jgi:hypothetical protein
MKTIWTGSDAMYLLFIPKHFKWYKVFYILTLRLFARLTDFFTQCHYACGPLVEKELKQFGMKKKIIRFKDQFNETKYDKIPHEGFNILYYFPKGNFNHNSWLYGWDIYQELKVLFPYANFIEVDGTQDMSQIYPIVDLYIRPNRHDGEPRMVDECKVNEIPFIATLENPVVEEFAEQIEKLYNELHKAQNKT